MHLACIGRDGLQRTGEVAACRAPSRSNRWSRQHDLERSQVEASICRALASSRIKPIHYRPLLRRPSFTLAGLWSSFHNGILVSVRLRFYLLRRWDEQTVRTPPVALRQRWACAPNALIPTGYRIGSYHPGSGGATPVAWHRHSGFPRSTPACGVSGAPPVLSSAAPAAPVSLPPPPPDWTHATLQNPSCRGARRRGRFAFAARLGGARSRGAR